MSPVTTGSTPDLKSATHMPDSGEHEQLASRVERDVAQADEDEEECGRDGEREARDVRRVGDRDYDERAQVVEHRERQHEHAQPRRRARREQRDRAERERRVGRHRRSPAMGAGPARVEREVDRDRDDHPAEGGDHGYREPPPLAQFPDVELALGLEADDEEEEGHEPLVDPVAEVGGDPAASRSESRASSSRAIRRSSREGSPR